MVQDLVIAASPAAWRGTGLPMREGRIKIEPLSRQGKIVVINHARPLRCLSGEALTNAVD
ncbi:hypothetical protein CUC53_15980 [Aeromonas cavernicola]|uniref:Uncharacterized protein n=1 Tax=Aeromonas cavernicola TaxID=1006623 RepID=A0A2H9U1C2_9GAMM|nr:hypothetical protein CUC53_15980 [Aeromonas cavernicola]